MDRFTKMGHGNPPLLSSDEAPDTGEDSDEDLITSYLNGGAGNGNNGTTHFSLGGNGNVVGQEEVDNNGFNDIIPAVNITPQSPNSNHILEDNLMQLAEIHENIQRMRLENAQSSRLSMGGKMSHKHNRLSNSCPSLNRDDVENANTSSSQSYYHNNRNNYNNNAESLYYDNHSQQHNTHSKAASATRKAKNYNEQQQQYQYRQKRMHGRQRSLSASSNDSDEFTQYHQQQQHPMPPSYNRYSSVPDDQVDHGGGGGSTKSRPRSASSATGGGGTTGRNDKAVFKTPPEVLMPRPPTSKKTPHIFAQFPGLHRSISTPSIVVDRPRRAANSSKYPEPTHVFLQKLISEHEWTRRSGGSDSDSEEDLRAAEFEQRRQRFLHENTPSPQISLAEFLQDVPNLEDDDQRKRRRKKERSSIFFRKKKDKSSSSKASTQQQQNNSSQVDNNSRSLSKVPSAITLNSNKQSYRVPHHSYSMSSLRKTGGSSSYQPSVGGSNFYVVSKGETSRMTNDDREELLQEETHGLIDGEFPLSMNEAIFPEGGPAAIRNLETDPFLRIQDPDEPESWQANCNNHRNESGFVHGLTPLQVKRQEHIYEFILTESNHCQVLKVVEKIFVNGLYKFLNMNKEIVDRIFPCIDQLIQLHFRFLEQLRSRQNKDIVVGTIADILVEQFTGDNAKIWKEAYGTFCSQHNEAVSVYKELVKNNRTFHTFVRQCAENPLLKKKGIPECILFITTRITKYPLLIEPLIKTAKDLPQEMQRLKDANFFVREILKDVNSRVAEKDREQRFLDIYKGIDAKSSVHFQGRKFKKSDVLSSSRKLMFEGTAVLHQGRSRSVPVTVVVLSDILFFLQESNQKYYFFTPEAKPAVIPVHTLLAQEKTGASTKALYIISTTEERDSEVYEVEIFQPPTREDWITGIREAVDTCPYVSDNEEGMMMSFNNEQARRFVEDKYMRMRHLTAELRGKDIDLAKLLEEKMRIMNDMLVVLGHNGGPFRDNPPDYISIIRESDSSSCTKEQLLNAVQEASWLASSIYSSASADKLSRSVSSAGERHSGVYTSPTLPKRAETFGGFDQQLKVPLSIVPQSDPSSLPSSQSHSQLTQQEQQQRELSEMDGKANKSAISPGDLWKGLPSVPPLLHLEPEQQEAAVRMTHYLNTLMCMVSEHFTSLESLKSELSEIREKSYISGGRYKHNQQLEELRNLHERFGKEKRAWQLEREAAEQEMESKKKELANIQNDIDHGLKDVKEQREQLYRKLDLLKAQGIEIMGPNMSVLKTDITSTNSGQSSHPQGELLYYSEKGGAGGTDHHYNVSPSGTVNLSSGSHNSAPPSSSSMRRNISPNTNVTTSTTNLTLGGSLKKDQVSNLNLLSTTNEAKGEKPEIRQQIPTKLISKLSVSAGGSGKERGSKKMSSAVSSSALKQPNLSNSSALSGSVGNIAKPFAEGGMHQMLPFKLSESETTTGAAVVVGGAPSASSGTSMSFSKKSGSPKQGYQKLSSTVSSSYSDQHTSQLEIAHQRTGSSPALIPGKPGSRSNAGAENSSQQPQNVTEDKVIYF